MRIGFILFYWLQTVVSVWFLYWLLYEAWNASAPSTSGVFFACEVIAFVSSTLFLFSGIFSCPDVTTNMPVTGVVSTNMTERAPSRRQEREQVPMTAVCLCRYNEPLEDLLVSIRSMLDIQWPAERVRIYILDDGFNYQSEDAKISQMREMSNIIPGAYPLGYNCLSALEEQEGDLPRTDCATKSFSWEIRPLDLDTKSCQISMVARVKPNVSHYKAGNVNNFLYNYCVDSASKEISAHQYILLLDHDMLPAPSILKEGVHLFSDREDMAFIQFPQRFYDISLNDRFYAGNEIFYDGVQLNRSNIGCAAFCGTNAIWSMSAFYHIGGMQYGSLTEDANTGYVAHCAGYNSLYVPLDLFVGQSPQTVPAAMKQRMRWSQGAIEMLFPTKMAITPCPSILRSRYKMPTLERQPLWKRLAMHILYLDSMIYPFYALGYILHVVVCLLYLSNVQAPMAPSNPFSVLFVWLPLYVLKVWTQTLAFRNCSLESQVHAQKAWAGYSLSTLVSIIRAFQGVGWFNTGSSKKNDYRFWLQYGNLVIFFVIIATMTARVVVFISGSNSTCLSPWMTIGALFYGAMMIYFVKDWALEPVRRAIYALQKWEKDEKLDRNSSDKPPISVFSSAKSRSITRSRSLGNLTVHLDEYNDGKSQGDDKAPQGTDEISLQNIAIMSDIRGTNADAVDDDTKVTSVTTTLMSRDSIFDTRIGEIVEGRDSYERHSINLSFLMNAILVLFCTVVLFVWAQTGCNPRIDSVSRSVSIPRPPLPDTFTAVVDFQAESKGISLNGQPFILKGANWFGFETDRRMVFGLNSASQDNIFHLLTQNGINSIRLPLVVEAVNNPDQHISPNWAIDEALNPHLAEGMDYLQAVEAFIRRASQWGVFVLLDMHLLRADTPNDPLPFDERTPFNDVIRAWDTLAETMCSLWGVMGADLKNEPHGVAWEDWRMMAEEMAKTVSERCPSWLIFVGGVFLNESPEYPLKHDLAPWGAMFASANESPVQILDESKLVYSPHVYGPGTIGPNPLWETEKDLSTYVKDFCLEQFRNANDPNGTTSKECNKLLPMMRNPQFPRELSVIYDIWFGFLRSEFNKTIIIGEWGGTYTNEITLDINTTEEREQYRNLEAMWNENFVEYMVDRELGSFYWSINPESDDTGGLFLTDWATLDTGKLSLLDALPSTPSIPIVSLYNRNTPLHRCLENSKILEVIYAADSGPRYEKESNGYNKDYDDIRKPAAIVFPRIETEISSAVKCSIESGLQMCVRSGGNSYTADSLCDAGILIDTRRMKHVTKVSNSSSTFWVESGNTMGDLTSKLHRYNRIAPAGNHQGVGSGWILGCGRGWLSRSFGLGCDYVVSARVVTSSGIVVEATDENEHKDLLWALRGAGSGHFGIVSSLLIDTFPLPETESFFTFQLQWPRNKADVIFMLWQDWAVGHKNNRFTCNFKLWNSKVSNVELEGVLWGTKEEFDEIMRELPTAILRATEVDKRMSFNYLDFVAHSVGVNDVLQLRDPRSGWSGERRNFRNKSQLLFGLLNMEGIADLLSLANEDIPGSGAYSNYIEITPLGGVIEFPLNGRSSAFSHRSAIGVIQYGGYWSDNESKSPMVNHQRRFRRTMEQYWGNHAFYNYKDNELSNWEEAYWGETSVEKLVAVKCQYDNDNMFSSMQQSLKC